MTPGFGPQPIISSRLALAFEAAGVKASAPTVYIIPNGTITPVSTKAVTKNFASGNRDPVLTVRQPEQYKVSIPMAAIIESNGLGELILATLGTDTTGSQLGSSGAYDHVITANDTVKTFTLWCWDTLVPQNIRLVAIDTATLVIDKEKNSVDLTFACIGAEMVDDSTFGNASYIDLATQKPNMIPASQSILEYGEPQSWISKSWTKFTMTMKENIKYGAPGKGAVPAGSSVPMLVVKGQRDTTTQIDFIDMDREELKRWRVGGDTTPTATTHQDVQALTKIRVRLFGSSIGTTAIWGYAHQANAGTAAVTWAGTYSGTGPAQFELKITTDGTPDKFMWRENGGSGAGIWSAEVSVILTPITLADGVTVTFSSTTLSSLGDTWYGFSFYQRMLEFSSPTNVIEDVNQASSTDFYKSVVKLFHESGPAATKPNFTLRNTKTSAYT